jgi:peptide/nickel transport system substrate-binding protein
MPLLRRPVAALVALITMVAVSACDLARAQESTAQPQRGGTLYVDVSASLGSLDPQGQYDSTAMNVLRLTTRTLTTYKAGPGQTAEIVPDLATDTGRASQNNTIWKFTLKPNVHWQGGELVTCSQVKYGIERSYSALIDGGVPYPRADLLDNQDAPYPGPYLDNDNNGKGLESIECQDEKTIVFHLSRPIGDFAYTLALSTFAPVIPAQDTKRNYGQIPYSNGPYKIMSRDASQLILVRNPFWSATNDQARPAYPEQIVITFRSDATGTVTDELIEDQDNARNEVLLNADVAPNFLQQVLNDPGLRARTVTGSAGVWYLAINTSTIPDTDCRKALVYAFDRRKWRSASSGAASGPYATSMIPPDIAGHQDFDVYGSLTHPEGDTAQAAALLAGRARAGHPCKTTVRLAFPDTAEHRQQVQTAVAAYQTAGINVVPVPLPASTYYQTGAGDPTNRYDLLLADAIPDWASGSAVLPPLFDGRGIPRAGPGGHGHDNSNLSMLNDPVTDSSIDSALAETDPSRQQQLWGELDKKIQNLAVVIPIVYISHTVLTGSNVVGGYISPLFGQPDLTALGLASP